jgi:signal transduction histidine kinase
VLVIEDSATFRAALTGALEAAGYRVLTAASGEQGLRMAADVRPAAVIVDGNLPGIDGPTVLRRLRGDLALRRTPALLLTASEEPDVELKAFEAGTDAFVRKDEEMAVILARLAAVLRLADAPAAVDSTASLLGPKRILAIDDSPTYLHELADRLREEGYEVALAHSGEEALELLAVQSVDCILLDLLMPGLSGQETCQRIKSHPAWRDIPLVMLSALEERDAMIGGITLGADDFVTKSTDFAVLKARLGAKLRRKQIEDENRLLRERLLREQMEAAEARAARELAETRGALLADLEREHAALERAQAQEHEAHEALKRAQSQLVQSEKLAALGHMVAGVAHEINNPLAFVVNNMAVLQRDVGALADLLRLYRQAETNADDVSQILDQIRANAERIDVDYTLGNLDRLVMRSREGLRRIEQIVTDLRGFARLDEGERHEADLNAGIASTVHIVQGQASARNVTIALELGELPRVSCHAAKINQVVLNLLANAIDACPDGGSVTVRTGCLAGGVTVEVADTGRGIAPAIRERIFDPFFTTKPVGKGTGLGLSISYGIAQEHGGTIAVESTPGAGACFTLWLPLRPPAGARSTAGVVPADLARPATP